jgi:hypothetical protein
MTIFGTDISSYQTGLDLSTVPDLSFVIAKCSEGTYYTDTAYPGFRSQASRLDVPFAWYHLVSGEPAAAQVAHTLACVGDPTLPGMIDCEPSGDRPGPTWAQIQDYVRVAIGAGLNLKLMYLPRWYWARIGSPNLTPLVGWVSLVSSGYPGGSEYPGDSGAGWGPYGGMSPLIWQYTDNRAGLDFNAYRGTTNQLRSILTASQGDDMSAVFATGQLFDGAGAKTLICPPPANTGTNWGDVWFSLGSDFGTAAVRVAMYVHGVGWKIWENVSVPANGDRVNPCAGPVPAGTQKISVVRLAGSENVPVGWLVEAQGR